MSGKGTILDIYSTGQKQYPTTIYLLYHKTTQRKKEKAILKKGWNYRRGDIYLADLGTHRGHIQGGIRPVINVQNNSGSFHAPTLVVVPITTGLKKLGQPTHCIIKRQRGLDKTSMSEAEQIVTIDKSQIIKYLGRASSRHMGQIDNSLRASLNLNSEDAFPIPKCAKLPRIDKNTESEEKQNEKH